MATQGIHRPFDLIAAQFQLPALAYLTMGSVDGLLSGLEARRSILVGATFALGVLVGPLVAMGLARWSPTLGIAVLIATPWVTGTLGLAWCLPQTLKRG